jgi:hypothetical protein
LRETDNEAQQFFGRADIRHFERTPCWEKLLRPGSRRKTVNWAISERNFSRRRACALAGIDPRVYRYRSTRPDDTVVRKRLHELAGERRRFGYRRLHILLKREDVKMNWKKLYRL